MVNTNWFARRQNLGYVALFVVLVLISLFGFLTQSASAAFSQLSSSLPDDSYKLYLPNGSEAQSNGLNCYTTPPYQHGNCTAGGTSGDSHQYITLSNGQIDDSTNDGDYMGANDTTFGVFASSASDKPLSLDLVERRIGQLGCTGFTLQISYTNPANGQITTNFSRVINGCGGVSLPTVDARYFGRVQERGITYAFKAQVRIQITGGDNRQSSFHLNTGNGAKLGYSEGSWVNTYPTNAADGHKISYSFRPPCDASSFQGPTSISWDDVDYQSQFQPNKPSIRLIRHDYNGGNRFEIFSVSNVLRGYDQRTLLKSQMYDANGNPYSFSLEFDGIRGGNGISFFNPFESALAKIECPDPPDPGEPPKLTDVKCSKFVKSTGPHSKYRFSVFPRSGNYVTSRPAENRVRQDLSEVGKKGFSQIPIQVVELENTTDGWVDKEFNFDLNNPRGPDYIVYIERYYHHDTNNNGTLEWEYITGDASNESGKDTSNTNCYSASCSVRPIDGSLGTNKVRAGENVTYTVDITNTGENQLRENYPLTLSGGNGPVVNPVGTINKGGSKPVTTTWTAPGSMGVAATNSVYPDLWGRFGLGAGCNGSVSVYQRYDFASAASTSLDDPESPRNATFTSSLTQQGIDVNGTSTRTFAKRSSNGALNPIAFGPGVDTRNFGSPTYTDTYPIPSNSYGLGDGWCTYISLDRGHGWRGPGEDYLENTPERNNNCGDPTWCTPGSTNCPPPPPPTVVNYPYFRAYGGDVAAGGGFGTSCGRTNSKILGYMRPVSEQIPNNGSPTSDKSGSGVQIAAMALDTISGVTSASTRTTSPTLPNGLTFAHGSGAISNTLNPTLGGGMNGDGWCAPDYYNTTQFTDATKKTTTTSGSPINLMSSASIRNEEQTVVNLNGTGTVTINSPGVYSKRHTIYVDGNAYINGNGIRYLPNYSAGISSIPSFTLIVKGNIYIDSSVTQLDGLYIAQPGSQPNSGRIYTCTNGTAPINGAGAIYNSCGAEEGGDRKQLTVNGAFIAEKVVLNRTGYTLRDSRYREPSDNTRAAEIFKFSPEIYLSPPVFRASGTETSGDYDYLSIMAPIL